MILVVMNAKVVVKATPERDSNADLCDATWVLYQLTYTIWEQMIGQHSTAQK